MQASETPIVTIAVLAPADRIAEARAESQTYHRLRGEDMPLDSFLVDEVRNAQGKLTHYSCERRLSQEDADHVMKYYRDQFRPGHRPAQVLTVEPLDDVLQRLGGLCAKHEQRKANRVAKKQQRNAETVKLQKQERLNKKKQRREQREKRRLRRGNRG